MRRQYIRNEELYHTLHQILNHQNPELLAIYKEVILYRSAIKFAARKRVEEILTIPTRMFCSFLNVILLPALCRVLWVLVFPHLQVWAVYTLCLAIGFVNLFFLWRFFRLIPLYHTHRSYLVVDELFARKILIVQQIRKKTA